MSDNLSMNAGATMALNSGALAAGTNAGTIKSTVAISFLVDGQFYLKAITDNIAISYSGPSVYQAAAGGVGGVNGGFTGGVNGSTRLFLLCLSTAGAVSIVPGGIVDTADLAAGRVALQFPDAPLNCAVFGALRVALTANTTFVPGTTALAATGVTSTFLNLATVPASPLTA